MARTWIEAEFDAYDRDLRHGRAEGSPEEDLYWSELKPALRSATPPEVLELDDETWVDAA